MKKWGAVYIPSKKNSRKSSCFVCDAAGFPAVHVNRFYTSRLTPKSDVELGRRIAACLNALDGIDDPEKFVRQLRDLRTMLVAAKDEIEFLSQKPRQTKHQKLMGKARLQLIQKTIEASYEGKTKRTIKKNSSCR